MLLNKKLTFLHLEKFYRFNIYIYKAFLVIISHGTALFTQEIHKLKGHTSQAGKLQKAGLRDTGRFYTNDGTPKSSWLVKWGRELAVKGWLFLIMWHIAPWWRFPPFWLWFQGTRWQQISRWWLSVRKTVLLGGRIAHFQYPCQGCLGLAAKTKAKLNTDIFSLEYSNTEK